MSEIDAWLDTAEILARRGRRRLIALTDHEQRQCPAFGALPWDNTKTLGPCGADRRMTTALVCVACGAELRSIAKFCDECGSPVVEAETPAEYKQVTVLFADVVGSIVGYFERAADRRNSQQLRNAAICYSAST